MPSKVIVNANNGTSSATIFRRKKFMQLTNKIPLAGSFFSEIYPHVEVVNHSTPRRRFGPFRTEFYEKGGSKMYAGVELALHNIKGLNGEVLVKRGERYLSPHIHGQDLGSIKSVIIKSIRFIGQHRAELKKEGVTHVIFHSSYSKFADFGKKLGGTEIAPNFSQRVFTPMVFAFMNAFFPSAIPKIALGSKKRSRIVIPIDAFASKSAEVAFGNLPTVKVKRTSQRRPEEGDPHTRLLPQFDVFSGGKNVGYVSRGHGMLWSASLNKQGYYAAGLARLERFEQGAFKLGKFGEYKTDILTGIGTHKNKAPFIAFITGLKEPVHIDFWRKPATAAYLMRRGYELSPPSVEELHSFGLKARANREEVHDFLENLGKRNFAHGESPLLVLTKPVAK